MEKATFMSTRQNPKSKLSPVGGVEPPSVPQEESERVEEVRLLAYYFWERSGYPTGSAEEDWFQAEREVDRADRIPGVADDV
jgi:hypothetical protein